MTGGLVEVRLIGVPLAIHRQAGEHSAEIMREFGHVAEGPGAANAPARLILLDRVLQEQYHRFTGGTSEQLDAAMLRGDLETDLTFTVPVEAGKAAETFGKLWDEVDAHCAEGRYLLALRSPPDVVAFRRWVLGEFRRQTGGEPPLSWAEWRRQRQTEQ